MTSDITPSTFDELLKEELSTFKYNMSYNDPRFLQRAHVDVYARNITQLVAREVIGDDLPVGGYENEANQVSLETIEASSINCFKDEARKALGIEQTNKESYE